MAHRLLLLLAVVGLGAGQSFPGGAQTFPGGAQTFPGGARPGRLGGRQQSQAPGPLWSPAGVASRPRVQPPQDISYRPLRPAPRPAPVRQCTAVSARVDLVSGVSDQISGVVFLYQECPDHPVMITGRISGLSPGEHGFHVHEHPNLSDQCSGAGGHFNPFKKRHGAQNKGINERHVGDLGNIVANYEGVAELNIVDDIISLFPGDTDIFRRSIVVHSDKDDLGRGGNQGSLKTGNAGMRLACGIIAPNNTPRCY